MRRFILLFVIFQLSAFAATAQTRVRDLFASAPDSIFPLLTKNNRLDCLDFKENNMAAKVKNRLEDVAELKELSADYLFFQMSAHSSVEMRLLNDSLFCLINTYQGPGANSRVRFFSLDWKPVEIKLPSPQVEDFWNEVPDSLQQTARFARQSLEDIRLVRINAQTGEPVLTFTLHTGELVDKEKEVAQQYVHPLRYRWDGQTFQPIP